MSWLWVTAACLTFLSVLLCVLKPAFSCLFTHFVLGNLQAGWCNVASVLHAGTKPRAVAGACFPFTDQDSSSLRVLFNHRPRRHTWCLRMAQWWRATPSATCARPPESWSSTRGSWGEETHPQLSEPENPLITVTKKQLNERKCGSEVQMMLRMLNSL